MDVQMPFSIEDCSLVFSEIAQGDAGRMTAIAAAARADDVRTYLAEASSKGCDPAYLFAEGLAIWKGSLCEIPPAGDVPVAVLKLEDTGAALCVGRGNRLIAAHALFSLDANHVKRLLLAGFGNPAALEWRIVERRDRERELSEFWRVLGKEWQAKVVMHEDPERFLARAVARLALGQEGHRLNLRQETLAHNSILKSSSDRRSGLSSLLAACGIAVGVVSLSLNGVISTRISELDREFQARAMKIAGGDLGGASGIHALQRAEKAVEARLQKAAPILAPFQPSMMSIVQTIAAESRRANLLIESLTVSQDEIRLAGAAPSWKLPEELERLFIRMGLSVAMEREESLSDESVHFSITAKGLR